MEVPPDAARAVEAEDLSGGELFEIVANAEGNASSIIGRFDIGLDESSSYRHTLIGPAVSSFLERHALVWGLAPEARLELTVGDVMAVDSNIHITVISQYVDGVRILDGDITSSFWANGNLHSVNSRFGKWGPTPEALDIGHAREIFAGAGVDTFEGELERGLSFRFGGVVWEHRFHGVVTTLDEDTLTIVFHDDGREELTGPCNVRRRDLPRTAGGRLVFGVLGNDVERVLAITSKGYAISGTNMTAEVLSLSAGHCRLRLRAVPMPIEGFQSGIISGVIVACGRTVISCAVDLEDECDGLLELTWR